MIRALQDNYYSSSASLPLRTYHHFFVKNNQASQGGIPKAALLVAWFATGVFAYPMFGCLALLGAGCHRSNKEPNLADMNCLELQNWGRNVTVQEWNEVQIVKMNHFFDDLWKNLTHLGSVDVLTPEQLEQYAQHPDYIYHEKVLYNLDACDQLRVRFAEQVRSFDKKVQFLPVRVIYEECATFQARHEVSERVEKCQLFICFFEHRPVNL